MNIANENCGILRDDGLLISKKISARITENICNKILSKHDLLVKIDIGFQSVTFLDITMDLEYNRYHPTGMIMRHIFILPIAQTTRTLLKEKYPI